MQIKAQAAAVGYPLMLKASWGGGGRGMRPIYSEDEIEEKVLEGRREAEAAFGNSEGYLERMIQRARHVEVQVWAINLDLSIIFMSAIARCSAAIKKLLSARQPLICQMSPTGADLRFGQKNLCPCEL